MEHTGCELHGTIQDDPLGLGAIRLQTGEWAQPCDDFGREFPPKAGQRVLVMRDDGIIFWITTLEDCLKNWP